MLQRYILRQAFWPLIASVSALGILALLTQSIATLDLIIDQRQSFLTFLQVTVLALPQLIALVLPLALFVAALYAANRLQGDSEIVVCGAAGMSPWGVASPIFKLAIAAMMANLAINIWIQPASFRAMRERLYEVRADLAARLVRPGQFRSPAKGLAIFVRDVDGRGRLTELFIEDRREPSRPVIYLAKTGVFTEVQREPALVMYDGSIQTLEANRTLSYLKFDSFPFELSHFIGGPEDLFYKLSDRYPHELLFPDLDDLWDWRHRGRLIAEGHYRFATPLYNPAFVLIALAGVVGGQFSRTGYGRRIAIAGVAALGARLVGFAVQSACVEEPTLNPLQYAVPILAGAGAAMWLLWPGLARSKPASVDPGLAPAPLYGPSRA